MNNLVRSKFHTLSFKIPIQSNCSARKCQFTHRLADIFLQQPMQFVSHVINVLFYIILGVIPLLLQLILHDHLSLEEISKQSPMRKRKTQDHFITPTFDWSGIYTITKWRLTSFSTKRFSMSSASCHCGLFSIGRSSSFVFTLGFLACGGWSDFFSPLGSSVVF